MKLHIQIKMNEALFLRDPQNSALGKKIIKQSIPLMNELGFEAFTFKKLAKAIGTSEAGIYRYFENKHALLVYLTAWYWSWLALHLRFKTNNISDPETRLKSAMQLLASPPDDEFSPGQESEHLRQLVISEGAKTYLSKRLADEAKGHFFNPYTTLCGTIAGMITELKPGYPYPKTLATTLVETAHFQTYCMDKLPALSELHQEGGEKALLAFLEEWVFSLLR